MARSTSVMNAEGVDIAWVNNIPITVDATGEYSVDIEITSTRAPGVCNTRENTRVVCPDASLPADPDQQHAALASLAETESKINSKHFIVTQHAKEYLSALNAKDSSYTNKLVEKTNLFCVEFNEKSEFKKMTSDFTMNSVTIDDQVQCKEISQFQQDTLPWFRKLTDDGIIKKTKERYDLSAFNSRVASPGIIVFTVKRKNILLGTLTLNLHTMDHVPESAHLGYLSDLFVAKGLEDDANFINPFISGIFAEIRKRFPAIKVLSGMAAAGDPTIPIVKCFNHIKKANLMHSFSRQEQERLGVVAQFTLDPKNEGNTHLPPLPLGTLFRYSLADEVRRQPLIQSQPLQTSAVKAGV